MPTVLIIPEGIETSNGISYEPGQLTWREQVPLMFLDKTTEQHLEAEFAGTMTNLRRQTVDGTTWIVGDLAFDSGEVGIEAQRLAAPDKMPSVSADVAVKFEETGEVDEMGFPVWVATSFEIVGVTQVPMPAFAGARILSDLEAADIVPALVAALVSGVELSWFDDPNLSGPTPLSVSRDGRVSGHLATWGACHIGYADTCVSPPQGTDYAYFHTGSVLIDETEVPVGHITMDTGHAALSADRKSAVSHYDHTGAVAADVRVGEDEYGIWVAGAARPGVDLDALRSASLSGDWRQVRGNLELVAALAVNVPGFPIPRGATAVAASGQLALVASGIVKPHAPQTEMGLMTSAVERLVSRIDDLLSVLVDEVAEPEVFEDSDPYGNKVSYGRLAAVINQD